MTKNLQEEIEAWLDLLITDKDWELASPKVVKRKVARGINKAYLSHLLKKMPKEFENETLLVDQAANLTIRRCRTAIKQILKEELK